MNYIASRLQQIRVREESYEEYEYNVAVAYRYIDIKGYSYLEYYEPNIYKIIHIYYNIFRIIFRI